MFWLTRLTRPRPLKDSSGAISSLRDARLLAFHFDNVMNAHRFLAARQALNMHAYIEDERQDVVIVRQP